MSWSDPPEVRQALRGKFNQQHTHRVQVLALSLDPVRALWEAQRERLKVPKIGGGRLLLKDALRPQGRLALVADLWAEAPTYAVLTDAVIWVHTWGGPVQRLSPQEAQSHFQGYLDHWKEV